MSKRPLRPGEQQAMDAHREQRNAERAADGAMFAKGDAVMFKPGDREKQPQPGVVTKVVPGHYGHVFWVDLGDGSKVRTLAGRLRRRKAFTLIDTLVTIAIIAVLISLLAPSIAMSIATTKANNCASQLRQVWLECMLLVEVRRGTPRAVEGPWVGVTPASLHCPSDRVGQVSYTTPIWQNLLPYTTQPREPLPNTGVVASKFTFDNEGRHVNRHRNAVYADGVLASFVLIDTDDGGPE